MRAKLDDGKIKYTIREKEKGAPMAHPYHAKMITKIKYKDDKIDTGRLAGMGRLGAITRVWPRTAARAVVPRPVPASTAALRRSATPSPRRRR